MRVNCVVLAILGCSLLLWSFVDCRRRRYRECLEERLKIREGAADVVLTGSVRRLYGDLSNAYSGEVLVKRVIKGDYMKAGETLIVEGFGNKDICSSKAIEKDTKIFLLSQLQTGRFRLNSSVIQINLQNLDKITAVVKGAPYRRRPPIKEEPCEKKYCKFNGNCHEEGRLAICRCPTSCVDQYNPICGSDGHTYSTECQMRVDSCRKEKRVYVHHEGFCAQSK